MTNKEYREKYPIGTKIKYGGIDHSGCAVNDVGKIGTIVGYSKYSNDPLIFLPKSQHISMYSTELVPVSWWSSWSRIEILLPQKNQQLLFSFMD